MALIRKIITQSTVDGPGNRFAIFMQGCNIRCGYCHNPETQAMQSSEAREMTVAEVIELLEPCLPFVRGITVSGGECMLQAEWVEELFRAVKRLGKERKHELTCLIDSNGTVDFSRYGQLMQYCDGVMLDVKAWEKDVYERLTGAGDNSTVKHNLRWLLEQDKLEEVRIVCVEGRVDVENILVHIAETFDLIGKKARVQLLRFRPQGVIGEMAKMEMTSDEQMQRYMDFLKKILA